MLPCSTFRATLPRTTLAKPVRPREPITKDALMAIRRPALVIAGARDQLAGPPQGLADAIMGAKAVTIPGCDHFSMIAHGLFKASVFDFFDGWLE